MTTKPIERYESDRSNWSAADHFAHQRTGNLPERPEYLAARAEALQDAGLETEDDRAPVEVADMDPAQHLRRIQGRDRV